MNDVPFKTTPYRPPDPDADHPRINGGSELLDDQNAILAADLDQRLGRREGLAPSS